jgi:cytochrome c-type biogenesis protein CcmE
VARSKRSPARLVVALSVAGLLAIFLVYTAVGGSSTPNYAPSELAKLEKKTGELSVTGKVVPGTVTGDAHSPGGLRFAIRDIKKPEDGQRTTVHVVFRGTVPDMFKAGRDVNVTGTLKGDAIVATGLTTKCPSKYTKA